MVVYKFQFCSYLHLNEDTSYGNFAPGGIHLHQHMKKEITSLTCTFLFVLSFGMLMTSCHKEGNHHGDDPYNADSLLANSKCANPLPAILQVPSGHKLV